MAIESTGHLSDSDCAKVPWSQKYTEEEKAVLMVRISTKPGLSHNKFAAEQTEFRGAAGQRRVNGNW
jgi:hypothetical protein